MKGILSKLSRLHLYVKKQPVNYKKTDQAIKVSDPVKVTMESQM